MKTFIRITKDICTHWESPKDITKSRFHEPSIEELMSLLFKEGFLNLSCCRKYIAGEETSVTYLKRYFPSERYVISYGNVNDTHVICCNLPYMPEVTLLRKYNTVEVP